MHCVVWPPGNHPAAKFTSKSAYFACGPTKLTLAQHERKRLNGAKSDDGTELQNKNQVREGTKMSAKKLAGKVAVVTGASKGIGASIAKHLAAEGAAVVV